MTATKLSTADWLMKKTPDELIRIGRRPVIAAADSDARTQDRRKPCVFHRCAEGRPGDLGE